MPYRARYRIRAVSEKTGVATPTLRSWEKRYGVPAPHRTGSAYRLYTDTDIALIVKMRQLCESGIAAAEAAKLVLANNSTKKIPVTTVRSCISRIRQAVRKFDPQALDAELRAALSLASPAEVYDSIFSPALAFIGKDWQSGTISVAHEHMATFAMESVLAPALNAVQPKGLASRVLLACVEDEEHSFGLYGVAFRLASWGVLSVSIGGKVPVAALYGAIEAYKPDAVGLSMTMALTPRQFKRMADGIAAWPEIPWMVGGTAVEGLVNKIKAVGGTPIIGADPQAIYQFLIHHGLVTRPLAAR